MAQTPKGTRRPAQEPARGTDRNSVFRFIDGMGSRQVRWLPPVVALAVAGLLIVGVVALVQASRGALSPTGSAPGGGTGSAATQPAPDFTLTTITGSAFHLAAERGRAVVVYFMATDCGSCLPGSHDVAQAVQTSQVRGAQAVMIDISSDDREANLREFARVAGVPATVPVVWGIDRAGRIATAYGVQTLETTVVIGAQGRIAYRSDGPVPSSQLAQIIRGLP